MPKPKRNLRATFPCPSIITDSIKTSRPAVYIPQLARFPGDPEARVTSKSDIRKLMERRGWSCEGLVDCDRLRLSGPPERYEVADDIVQRKVEDVIEREHGGKVSEAKRRELMEQWKERMSGTQD